MIIKKNIISVTGLLGRTKVTDAYTIEWFDCVDGIYRRVHYGYTNYRKAQQLLLFFKGRVHRYPEPDFPPKIEIITNVKRPEITR